MCTMNAGLYKMYYKSLFFMYIYIGLLVAVFLFSMFICL